MAVTGIVIEHRGPAVWLRLNAPERRNAYDPAMAGSITEAVENAAGAHAVVITGSGGAFCAGGALQQLSAPTAGQMRELYRASLLMFDAIRQCPRPVIAAVNGAPARRRNRLGGACDLA